MNSSFIPPRKRTIHSNSKKMPSNTAIFGTFRKCFVVMRSSTSPMQIGSVSIHIIPYSNQPLDFVILLQGESIDLNFFGDIDPIDSPPILFLELSQKRATFNFEYHSFFDFACLNILETRNNFIQPNVNTSAIQRIIHLSLLPAYKLKKAGL